jgi:hypothetical protein
MIGNVLGRGGTAMTDDPLAFLSATGLAAAIRARRLSPGEVMRATLDRISHAQPILNAFITIAADTAMTQARKAEAALMRGGAVGPLHGLPVAVKDLVPTAGIRTTWGSLIFKDHVPDADAVVVARLKQAGAIIVGKTTTPEFGQQCLTEAPLFGRTRNAWRGDRAPRVAVPAAPRWPWRRVWCRWRWRRMVAVRPAFPPRATASSASSKVWASCRKNTHRMASAIFLTLPQ